jgi:hypothetical protein
MEAVLADREFTHAQKTILTRLALHLNLKTGRLDPSIKTLAGGAGVTQRAAQTALAKAQALGWIRRHVGGGGGNTNSYSLLPKPIDAAETLHGSAPLHGGAPCAETFHGETRLGGALEGAGQDQKPCTAVHPNKKNSERNNAGIDFEQFWQLYPRRVGKGHARVAFEKIVRAGRFTVDELKAGAKRYAAECAAANREPRYIKHPQIWLNGECWAEEPLSMEKGDLGASRAHGKVAAVGGWDPRP